MTDDQGWGVGGDSPPGEGWWRASDDRWYPPETAPGAAPTPPGVPPAEPPVTSPGDGDGRDGGSRLNPVLMIVAAVVVVGAIVAGIVLVTSGGDDDDAEVSTDATPTAEPTATPTPTDEVTPSVTATPEPTATAEPTGTVTPTPTAEPTATAAPTVATATGRCRYLGIDSFGDMQISLELESPETAESLVVGYTVLDPDGRVLVRSDVFVDLVVEGESLSLPIDTFTAAPDGVGVAQIDCEIGPVGSAVPFFELLPEPADATCAVAGLSDFDEIQLDVVFTSPASETVDATVITGLYRDGARVVTIPTFVDRLGPDEPIALAIETFETLPPGSSVDDLDCVLLGVVDDDFEQDWSDPVDTDVCVVMGVDSFGDVQVELVVTNPFPEPIDLDVLYVIRGPDGGRLYSVSALTDTADVGETVIVDHDSFSSLPDSLTALDVTCEVLGVLRF